MELIFIDYCSTFIYWSIYVQWIGRNNAFQWRTFQWPIRDITNLRYPFFLNPRNYASDDLKVSNSELENLILTFASALLFINTPAPKHRTFICVSHFSRFSGCVSGHGASTNVVYLISDYLCISSVHMFLAGIHHVPCCCHIIFGLNYIVIMHKQSIEFKAQGVRKCKDSLFSKQFINIF